MAEPLLKTKCIAPTLRPQLVARRHLVEKLRRAMDVPLTLVSAPPGFGKTTAALAGARALQAESGVALAWLSLDALDNEPARFWRYCLAALQIAAPGVGAAIEPALAMPQPPPAQPLLAALINEVADRPEQLLFVLDDYQLIEQAEIHDGLAFLLDHAPPNLHLVLATRADPPLPLHRWRARGQLLDIRAEDLRFDLAESAALLTGVMALALTGEDVARLAEQTEGWVAGLQLAGLALQGAPRAQRDLIDRLARSNRYILEYLAEEVLAQQTPRVQTFLLQTAILSRLCGPLCDAVTQEHDGQELLELLARRNLFVAPVDSPEPAGEQSWFRYHQLFADLLQGQLRQQLPEQTPLLHQRAAAWYEANGDVAAAVEHALAGEDYPRVVRLIDRHASGLVMEGRILTVERWLGRLPDEWRQTLPRASLAFGWALLLRGRYAEVEPYLQQAEAAIGPDDRSLRGELHAQRAALANTQGRAAEALDHARQAIDNVAPDNLFVQGMAHFAMASAQRDAGDTDAAIAAYERAIPLCRAAGQPLPEMLGRAHLGYLYIVQGRLRRAETTTRPALASPVRSPASSAVRAALGEVLLEWNRLDEAELQLQQAQALARQSGHNAALVRIQTLIARLRWAQGDAPGAQAMLDEAAAQLQQGAPGWVEPLLVAEQAQLWLNQGTAGTAERLLGRRGARIDPAEGHVREVLPLMRVRLLHHQGRHAEALALADEVARMAEADGRQGRAIEALLLRALARDALGEGPAACQDLRRALALAEPEGYVRVFLDAGPPVRLQIADCRSQIARQARGAQHDENQRLLAYCDMLLAVFPDSSDQPPDLHPSSIIPHPLIEPLTEREIEVLRLMARGLTYQQIADEIIVSINTVRHHVKGLYGKLQVDTRTLALERARALGLL
ncbi:MAG: helix-turn-helix transcriptional regulator [Kouleothrix sp.]|nr:helix-turn-helix transcriptional regulator [Kouleothrix sp.]